MPPTSLARAFAAIMDAHAEQRCLGWRALPGAEYSWASYADVKQQSVAFAAWLRQKLRSDAHVGIMGHNCYEWFVADLACLWAGLCSVPLSDGWEPGVLEAVLAQTQLAAVVCTPACYARVASAAVCEGSRVTHIIVTEVADEMYARVGAVACVGLPDVLATASAADPTQCWYVERDAGMAHTILHTSGTTGLPKGVVYTDGLWLANMQSYEGAQVGFSYMPLAFITDRHTVYTALWNGGCVGIATARQGGDTAQIFRDLLAVRPTVLKGVPAFWEHVAEASRMVQDRQLAILGGRARVLCCGAGAISEEVARYFRACRLGSGEPVQFLELYGCTECGNLALNRQLLPHVEWRLLPLEGDGAETARVGEFVVKTGKMMFAGYHGRPALTTAAFTADGFYRTGDVVRVRTAADGATLVDVLGRAKSSLKLANGKWVHPETLEDLYRGAAGVRLLYVHGDAAHAHLVAVVEAEGAPSEERLLAEFGRLATAAGRPRHERISGVVLSQERFSQAAGTLNGTGKLVRRALYAAHEAAIEERLTAQRLRAPLEHLEAGRSFAEQGGTSLDAARIARLYAELGVPLQRVVAILLQASTVGAAEGQLRAERQCTEADPLADCALAELTPPAGSTGTPAARLLRALVGAQGHRVLLTGATGFVGRAVLAELLEREVPVTCLVRASSEAEAAARLQHALLLARRWRPEWHGLLLVARGALGPEDLGMGGEAWGTLARSTAAIIHCAAAVDLKKGYAHHRRANVLGTREVLRLAAAARAPLVFVSTTDVLPHTTAAAPEVACTPADVSAADSGYAASKAVGECLVAAAARRGDVTALIARLGMVAACARTGSGNETDFVSRLLVGVAAARAFPQTEARHTMVQSVPVDVTAAALCDLYETLRGGGGASGAVVHVVSGAPPQPMAALREVLLAFGPPFDALPLVPYAEWMRRVRLEAQLSLWPVMAWAEKLEEFPTFNRRGARLGACCEHVRPATAAALRRGVDDEALHRALRVLFATSATLRWDALRAHHRRLSGVSGASAVLSAVRLARRRAAMRNSLILVVAMLAAVYVRRRL